MSRAAIAGDIAGSRFEWSLWEGTSLAEAACVGYESDAPTADSRGSTAHTFDLFHAESHPTDDSVLMVAVMDWVLEGGDPRASLRHRFRKAPRPELFGKFFRTWAESESNTPCGSIGNGAAMRIAPVAYAARTAEEVLAMAHENALATHATVDGIAGAQAVALGVFLARSGTNPADILREISRQFGYDLDKPLDAWRPGYRFTSACPETVPIAFRAFLETNSHEAAIRAAISLGGDTDTIACMAGALAGAFRGITPSTAQSVGEKLDVTMMATILEFERRYPEAVRFQTV